MSTLVIPTRTDLPAYVTTVTLEGRDYQVQLTWNDRALRWYFDLLDSTGSPIVSGLAALVGAPLLQGIVDIRRPPGDFMAIDTSGKDLEAGLTDLGGRVQLYYVPSTDMPSG